MADYDEDYRGLTMTSPIGDVKRVLREFFVEVGATTLDEAKDALTYKAAFDDEVYESIAHAGPHYSYDSVLRECLAKEGRYVPGFSQTKKGVS